MLDGPSKEEFDKQVEELEKQDLTYYLKLEKAKNVRQAKTKIIVLCVLLGLFVVSKSSLIDKGLVLSAKNDSISGVKFFLTLGADVDGRNQALIFHSDYNLKSPLIYAVTNNNVTLGEFLIKNGADVNFAFGEEKIRPLDIAKENKYSYFIYLLVNNGADRSRSIFDY